MVIQILVIQNSVFRIRINFPSFFDSFVTSTRFFHDPFELRSLNKKPQIFDLPSFIFLLQFLSNLRSCSNKKALIYYECFSFLSDLDRIQTLCLYPFVYSTLPCYIYFLLTDLLTTTQ